MFALVFVLCTSFSLIGCVSQDYLSTREDQLTSLLWKRHLCDWSVVVSSLQLFQLTLLSLPVSWPPQALMQFWRACSMVSPLTLWHCSKIVRFLVEIAPSTVSPVSVTQWTTWTIHNIQPAELTIYQCHLSNKRGATWRRPSSVANIRACTWDILLDSLLALSIIETCVYGLVMLSNELELCRWVVYCMLLVAHSVMYCVLLSWYVLSRTCNQDLHPHCAVVIV